MKLLAALIAAVVALLPYCANAQMVGNGSPQVTTVNAQSTQEKQVATGWVFTAGSTALSVSIVSNLRYTISNPANSTRSCYVFGIYAFATITSYAQLFTNPTVVPNTPRAATNLLIGAVNAPNCAVNADTSTTPMSGGVASTAYFPIPSGSLTNIVGPPIVVPPGSTLGFNIALGGIATSSLTFAWYEV